jgi:hypothetical protein
MNVRNQFVACVALCLVAATSSLASAQGRGGGVPAAVPPPQNFDTSTEHYEYLKRLYNGGTVHTHASVPKWEGLWSSGGNNGQGNLFLEAGEIIEGVLTPPYEAAFQMRRRIMAEQGQQPYDRLTTCEPAGMPRWLVEPYVREWVNTPTQSWWLNDLANDTRRIHITQDHQNVDGSHSSQGDSVGFWVGDMLIVHTVDVYPNDYFRGLPPSSNQFESVEVYRMETQANGAPCRRRIRRGSDGVRSFADRARLLAIRHRRTQRAAQGVLAEQAGNLADHAGRVRLCGDHGNFLLLPGHAACLGHEAAHGPGRLTWH